LGETAGRDQEVTACMKPKGEKTPICLTTYYTKNIGKCGELCVASLKAYADRFGTDLKLHNEIKSNRPPAWNKILVVKKLLDDYEYVLWVDSDAVMVRFDKDIRDEMEPGKYLYLVKFNLSGKEVPNSGVFLIRNSEWSKNFLDDVWGMRRYIYHEYWENAAVIDILGYEDSLVYNNLKIFLNTILYNTKTESLVKRLTSLKAIRRLLSTAAGSRQDTKLKDAPVPGKEPKEVKWLSAEWNSAPGIHEVEKPVIEHYPARPYKERYIKMAEALKRAGVAPLYDSAVKS
jgi:hypothetical protein